jgi:predicted nucleic acid-binding protein
MAYLELPEVPLVVCDANLFVSGGTVSKPPLSVNAQVVDWWRRGAIEVATCDAHIGEIEEVLSREGYFRKLGWTPEKAKTFAQTVKDGSLYVTLPPIEPVSPDPDDDYLFALAKEATVDAIVSGDREDVLSVSSYQGIPTVSPGEFIRAFRQVKKAA